MKKPELFVTPAGPIIRRLRAALNNDWVLFVMIMLTLFVTVPLFFNVAERLSEPFADYTVEGMVEIEPPALYHIWFEEVEECLGATSELYKQLQWYEADALYDGDESLWGIYDEWHGAIVYVKEHPDQLWLEDTVKHEFIHHLSPNADHETYPNVWAARYEPCTPYVEGYEEESAEPKS